MKPSRSLRLCECAVVGQGRGQQRSIESLSTRCALQGGFAGQQLGAAQGANQFGAGLRLNSLGTQGNFLQFLQSQQGLAAQQNLGNQFQFGQFPLGVQQQGISQALGALGPLGVAPPQQLQFPRIFG